MIPEDLSASGARLAAFNQGTCLRLRTARQWSIVPKGALGRPGRDSKADGPATPHSETHRQACRSRLIPDWRPEPVHGLPSRSGTRRDLPAALRDQGRARQGGAQDRDEVHALIALPCAPPLLGEAGLDGSETRRAVRRRHRRHGRDHAIMSHGKAISVFSERTPSIWSINSEVAARTIFSNGMPTEWR